MSYTNLLAAFAVLSLSGSATCFAQHGHHRPAGAIHHRDIQWVDPGGHVVRQHRDDYHYVLPSTSHHGSYYSYNNAHYYTPPAPPVIVNQPVVVQKPVEVQFGSFQHYEELATRLAAVANEVCLDLNYNYRRNPRFAEVYREGYKVLQDAKYVHGSEHRGDKEAIRAAVGPMDELFHHVREEAASWRGEDVRRVGSVSLSAKLEEMEALIHHLMFDAGIKHRERSNEEAPPPPPEEAPPPPGQAPPLPAPGIR